MGVSRGAWGLGGAIVALSVLALAPSGAAILAKAPKKNRYAAISLAAPGNIGSFTPAADPRRAAAFGRANLGQAGAVAFRFTPAAAPGSRRAVTVAVRARATTTAQAERAVSIASAGGFTPSAYNLGVSVGWKRFAVSGDIAKVDVGPLPGGSESADVGVSYLGNRWSARFQLGADRSVSGPSRLIGSEESYSADLGGSYSLTRNLEVTGGVRYKLQRDRLEPLVDERRDSQAVYIGTAFRF